MNHHSFYQSEIYEGSYIADISAFYSRQWQGFEMDCHAHKRCEIMYIKEGGALLYIQKPREVCSSSSDIPDMDVIEFKQGDMVFIDALIWHQLYIHKQDTCHIYNIEFSFMPCQSSVPGIMRNIYKANPDFQKFCASRNPFIMIKDADTSIAATTRMLIKELSVIDHKNTNHFMKNYLLVLLLLYIARSSNSMQRKTQCLAYLKQADVYIRQNFTSQIKIADIAFEVKLSPAYLQRLFKKHNEMTLSEYITWLRINHAKMLIENTDLLVKDIAIQSGYRHRQSLYYSFKQVTGMNLQDFRKSNSYKNVNIDVGH